MLVKVLWSIYFTQAQEYSVDQNIMYQENMATMRLKINGSPSRFKHTKHIEVRKFSSRTRWTLEKLKLNIAPKEFCGQLSSIKQR